MELERQEEEKRLQKNLERLRRLRPIDDSFARRFFRNNLPLIQFVLRIIMRKPDLVVIRCEVQKDFKRLAGSRSLVLDIYAEDSQGGKYNIELERSSDRADPRRVRYHQDVIDVEFLGPREDFSNLPELYIIFIVENDYFGEGRPFYQFERMDVETGRLLEDGTHIIYVNGAYRDDSDFGKLMHDFCCSDAKDMYLPPMAERTRYFKENEKGVKEMCQVFEEILNEGREEGMEKGREEGREEGMELTLLANLKSIMKKFGLTVEQAMDALNVTPETRVKLAPQM